MLILFFFRIQGIEGGIFMSKNKQSAVVFHPDEMAAFGRNENEQELTLFTLEARVKNLENTVRVLLEQVTDLSMQLDDLKSSKPQPSKPKQPEQKKQLAEVPLTPEALEQLTQQAMETITSLLSETEALNRDAIRERTGLSGSRISKALKRLRKAGKVVHENGTDRLAGNTEGTAA